MALYASLTSPAGRFQVIGAAALLFGAAATVGTALVFEHVWGYLPCALCLEQRTPYYVSVVLALAALASAVAKAPGVVVRGLLLLIGAAMLYGLALGVYHAGVEWKFWAGPTDCAATGGGDLTGDLLSTMDAVQPPACDRAAGRFLGLSFAGWNVVASAILASIAIQTALGRGESAASARIA